MKTASYANETMKVSLVQIEKFDETQQSIFIAVYKVRRKAQKKHWYHHHIGTTVAISSQGIVESNLRCEDWNGFSS